MGLQNSEYIGPIIYLNDPNPNWSNRPPKETILLDGCDFEHWLVVMEKPEGDPTRGEIVDSYIKTLAQIFYLSGLIDYFTIEEAIFAELPRVVPDSYLDVKNKDYGASLKSSEGSAPFWNLPIPPPGEPFMNGQGVPYDPKYHEEWVRNSARANERNRRNDRPRNADRSRNFQRENIVNRDTQGRPPMPNAGPHMSPS
ncbi:multiple organellar RNA editing factor 8, chloroplastic/mitochondrial-like [Prosopis cineraria]|uniref:multiple organellar RNA editing factor 8, chloroplastic/mitochondrial-like n=1 Tax=Prosopis cineraria TaxID=364024 RepID=UPI00240FE775|nr:multiple organellar RNA editing factor 8, chloroplastic/mitochondrial-like [Prosopis cineraria]